MLWKRRARATSIIRDGNHFIRFHNDQWVLIDGPWFEYINFHEHGLHFLVPKYRKLEYTPPIKERHIECNLFQFVFTEPRCPEIDDDPYVMWNKIYWHLGRILSLDTPRYIELLNSRTHIGWIAEGFEGIPHALDFSIDIHELTW